MTTAEVEERFDLKVAKKWAVIVLPDRMLWKQTDGTWVDYADSTTAAPVPQEGNA